MARKTHHVVPHPKGGWGLKAGGSSTFSERFETKEKALTRATEVAKKAKSELVIHKKDGKIQNSNSFGGDPFPPRDTV